MTNELLKKRAGLLRIMCFYTACAEEKLRLRICNFYLQTFTSALTWSLPPFISCIKRITKTRFLVFVGSLDWHSEARGLAGASAWMEDSSSFWGALSKGEASVLMVEYMQRGTVRAYPHSHAHYQRLDTKCRS